MRADAPLRVTESLLRSAIDASWPQPPSSSPDESVWLETIRLASAHLVLPALSSGLDASASAWTVDGEVRAYLDAIRAGNAARNRRLATSLGGIVARLQGDGIDPLVVKGGAWLADARDAAPWRFMGDLDLIVGADELPHAIAALTRAGFLTAGDDYDPRRDAHAPAMLAPDGETIVELHSRPFADLDCPALAAALASRACARGRDGISLLIPSPEVRLAYLLLHSQEHHAYHAQHRLLLRDLLEIGMLWRGGGVDFAAALALVPEAYQPRAGALLAAAENFGLRMPGIIFAPSQRQWAGAARRQLLHRVFHRQLTGTLALAGYEARRLMSQPKRILTLARGFSTPARMHRKILKKIRKFRYRAAG